MILCIGVGRAARATEALRRELASATLNAARLAAVTVLDCAPLPMGRIPLRLFEVGAPQVEASAVNVRLVRQ